MRFTIIHISSNKFFIQFHATDPFLYTMETSDFSNAFRGYRKRLVVSHRLMQNSNLSIILVALPRFSRKLLSFFLFFSQPTT